MRRIINTLSNCNFQGRPRCAVIALCATMAITPPTLAADNGPRVIPATKIVFTTLSSLPVCNNLQCPLVQGTDGNLYGITDYGGNTNENCPSGCGTIFKITPNGTLTTLYSFCAQNGCTDGGYPTGGLIQATDGNLYGTASSYGANGYGTVFKITLGGMLTTLYSFCSQVVTGSCTDGAVPYAPLVQGTNGDFYGTTSEGGGPSIGIDPYGTVFKITSSGKLTTLHSFYTNCPPSGCTDGFQPYAGLVQATNGDFYGTTAGYPSIFKITPSGNLTTLCRTCGGSALVQATDGDFYGTTPTGGVNAECYDGATCGTVFKITADGKLATLYSFCSQSACTDGALPLGPLIQATDGDFYGTTWAGGDETCGIESDPTGCGTVFKITPHGRLTTLHTFSQSGFSDGFEPASGLVQYTNGDLYGTTSETVFSLSVGFGPFVEALPISGKVGAAVEILGTNLIDAASVTFNGTAATFTVNATGTAISTTVPVGATTGTVQVTLSGGSTLSSNVPFRVT
jgi:uncharacterized repeat protein (TIGR03803 family)